MKSLPAILLLLATASITTGQPESRHITITTSLTYQAPSFIMPTFTNELVVANIEEIQKHLPADKTIATLHWERATNWVFGCSWSHQATMNGATYNAGDEGGVDHGTIVSNLCADISFEVAGIRHTNIGVVIYTNNIGQLDRNYTFEKVRVYK